MRHVAWLGSSVLFLLTTQAVAAVPAGFEESPFSSASLTQATGMAWAPDGSGRLFVVRKSGEIRVVRSIGGRLETAPDTTSLISSVFAAEPAVYTHSECGLLGITFDPNYVVNRFVYVFVTISESRQQIVRYTDVDGGPDAAGTGQRRSVVIANLPTTGQNHVGGGLAIDADGKLMFAIGDLGNGSGVDADLTSTASKLSRANLDGTPANDNPFNDGVGPNNEYIWARGFRNPFGLVRQPTTGRLWVNVAGTNYEQVFTPSRRDHAGYDDYENNQPPANYLLPAIVYRTNGVDTRNLTALVRAAGVVTGTTPATHGFRRGQTLTVVGVADATFAGTMIVTSTPTATTFTAAQAGADASTSGGTATTENLGGAITRGDFYDATAFPAEYRGNFFFGDFNLGTLVRARVSGTQVDQYSSWGSAFSQNVQVVTGPDGALYTIGSSSGTIRRVAASAPAGGLVVSSTHPYVLEGGRAAFSVSLASAPAADLTVSVTRADGDADLAVSSGAALVFTPSNWQSPQTVVLTAAPDGDLIPDEAGFDVSAPGLTTERVDARSIESSGPQLVVSPAALSVPEGGEATFTVVLSRQPSSSTVVTVTRTQGDADLTVVEPSALTFTSANWATPQTVTVAAATDDDSIAGRATLTLASPLVAAALEVTEIDDDPPVIPDAGDDAASPEDAGSNDDAGTSSGSSSSSSGQASSSGGGPSSSGATNGSGGSGTQLPPEGEGTVLDDDPAGGGCTMHAMATGSSLWLGLGLLALRRHRRRHGLALQDG